MKWTHNKTHAKKKKKKKVQLHPTWIGALGMCPRYPVPFLAAFLPCKIFLRGMDHQPSRGVILLIQQKVFILLSEHTNFLRKGVSHVEAYPEPRRRPPILHRAAPPGLLEFTMWPPTTRHQPLPSAEEETPRPTIWPRPTGVSRCLQVDYDERKCCCLPPAFPIPPRRRPPVRWFRSLPARDLNPA